MKKSWIILPAAALAVLLFLSRFGGSLIPSFKPVEVKADPSQPIVVKPDEVLFTPRAGKDDPQPKPVSLWKPLEADPSLAPDGRISIPLAGFTFIPKAGVVYILGQGFQAYGSARVFFLAGEEKGHPDRKGLDWGLEIGANTADAFGGIDLRDPFFNLLTTSVGAAMSWRALLPPAPYIGESATLSL